MSTIQEIAKKAGVSKSTVSRVINNTGLVNPKTEARIQEMIREMKYSPNEVARTLSNKKSNVVGFIIPKASHNFFSLLVEKVDENLAKHGYSLMIGNAFDEAETEHRILNLMRRYLVDGMILASHTSDLSEFSEMKMPLVSFDRVVSSDVPFIESNNFEGGRLATEHLVHAGCKHLVHIAGAKQLDSPANRRGEAFESVCQEHEVTCNTIHMGYKKFDFKDNFHLIEEMFKQYPETDGVFASNDALGISVIKVAQKLGKRVPEDVQVVGYDDVEIAQLTNPELTTIRQSTDKIAEALVENVVCQIEKKPIETHITIPVELIKRGSTKDAVQKENAR